MGAFRPTTVTALVLAAACSSSTSTSTAPTDFDNTLVGIVTRHHDGAPVVGATVQFGSASALTGPDGRFSLSDTPRSGGLRLALSAPGYLDREVALTVPAAGTPISIDMIENAQPFQYDFYRWFARAGQSLTGNQRLATLRPWTVDPSFYLRTITEDTGEAIPPYLLAEIVRVFEASVPELSGGRRRVAAIEFGTAPPPASRSGWVDVTFYREHPNSSTTRGSATVGGNSGRMLLRYDPERDDTPEIASFHSCAATIVYVAEHEITHTMGFWHAGSEGDFNDTEWACAGTGRSARARYHASLVYSRPRGNADPDLDPFPPLPMLSATDGTSRGPIACSLAELQ